MRSNKKEGGVRKQVREMGRRMRSSNVSFLLRKLRSRLPNSQLETGQDCVSHWFASRAKIALVYAFPPLVYLVPWCLFQHHHNLAFEINQYQEICCGYVKVLI
jgi:hypothetical protein